MSQSIEENVDVIRRGFEAINRQEPVPEGKMRAIFLTASPDSSAG
jgi:RecB family endonuclease NucS